MFDKNVFTEKKNITEKDLEALFDEATKRGAVLAHLFFDAHGPTEESVRNSLVDLVSRISQEKGVLYCRGEVEKAVEKDGLLSSFTEVKILCDHFITLVNVALKYGPVASDLVKPKEVRLELDEAQRLLLDISQASQDYTTYILSNVLPESERVQLQEQVKRRAEFGKELREKNNA